RRARGGPGHDRPGPLLRRSGVRHARPGGRISGRARRTDDHQSSHEGRPRPVDPHRAGEREPEKADDLRRSRGQVQDERGICEVAKGENAIDHHACQLARARTEHSAAYRRADTLTSTRNPVSYFCGTLSRARCRRCASIAPTSPMPGATRSVPSASTIRVKKILEEPVCVGLPVTVIGWPAATVRGVHPTLERLRRPAISTVHKTCFPVLSTTSTVIIACGLTSLNSVTVPWIVTVRRSS